MPETTPEIIFSRHAKRRMKLYRISEEHVKVLLMEGDRQNYSSDRLTYTKDMPEFKYPLKAIIRKEGNTCTIITVYPLKRRETKDEGIL